LIALRGIQLSGPPQVTVSWVLPLSWDVVAQVRSAEYSWSPLCQRQPRRCRRRWWTARPGQPGHGLPQRRRLQCAGQERDL